MSLEQLLRANRSFVKKNIIPGYAYDKPLLIISDSHPGLTGLLETLLDLQPGSAMMVRLPGAFGGPEGKELHRSVITGIALYGCRQVLVVGYDVPEQVAPDYSMLKDVLERSDLDVESSKARDILAAVPSEITRKDAVSMTVGWIRSLPVVDENIEVFGAMVSAKTGQLQLVDTDESDGAGSKEEFSDFLMGQKQPQQPVDTNSSVSFDIPQLPEIDLPEIPELDLDSLLAESLESDTPGQNAFSMDFISKDGSGAYGSGPVSIADMKKIVKSGKIPIPGAPPLSSEQRTTDVASITAPGFSFPMPESGRVMDTGMANAEGVQVPLGENVVDFGDTPKKPPAEKQGVVVNLRDGFIESNGNHEPIDPNLVSAVVKTRDFVQQEFASVDRAQILGRIRKAYHKGRDTKDMLKLLVTPILRLGDKRYAVINDLLKMKDVMPKYSRKVFIAFVETILGG